MSFVLYKLTKSERADLDRYIKNLAMKTTQVICQSRRGEKVHLACEPNPTVRNYWVSVLSPRMAWHMHADNVVHLLMLLLLSHPSRACSCLFCRFIYIPVYSIYFLCTRLLSRIQQQRAHVNYVTLGR